MKRLLNTLYVTTQGAYLCREGETVHVRVEKETKLRVPIHTLGAIVCFGNVTCTPFLMGFCGERDVGLAFFTEYGRFLCRVEGPVNGNVLLRREQYRQADDETATANIARSIVGAKVANSRAVLMRAAREHAEESEAQHELEAAARRLARWMDRLNRETSLDEARGGEGDAARVYFNVFDHLILAQREDFRFTGRSRRPPLDPVNALLSFLYTLLVHDCASACQGVGLDPAVGYLHRDRPGRPGLALDLMEEFRAFLADRVALSLINRQQIRGKAFRAAESGAVTMDDETRKEVLTAYQKRKQEEILHPFLGERVPIGLLPHVQALLLARYLRGDLDGYPPFFWK